MVIERASFGCRGLTKIGLIFPKTITSDEVLEIETLYKHKLLTKEFYMNYN